MFRVNGYDNFSGEENIEFYFKVEDDGGYVLCNLCIDNDGIYYYPPKARVLTDKEHKTKHTKYQFLSMEDLNVLFETLKETDWFGSGDDVELDIYEDGSKVIIEEASDDVELEIYEDGSSRVIIKKASQDEDDDEEEDDDSNLRSSIEGDQIIVSNKSKKDANKDHSKIGEVVSQPVWKPMKSISIKDFESWLRKLDDEPYLSDPFLQSVDWIKSLTKAIKKVEPLVGEGKEIEFLYWDELRSWEFILNCLSICRAIGDRGIGQVNFGKPEAWKDIIVSFRFWVDTNAGAPQTQHLFSGGTDFFWDMIQFFNSGRELSNPVKLAKNVLKHK